MSGNRVTLAVIAGAHGINGDVRLKLFAESPESLLRHAAFEAGGRTLTLKSAKPSGNAVLARFAEVTSRDAAEALRGTELSVPRDLLPPLSEGEHYHADLIGLPCVTPDGTPLGTVVAVENYGAGDILEIERAGGTRFMVPFRPEAVLEVGEQVVIEPGFVI